jgi:hypothetical protein
MIFSPPSEISRTAVDQSALPHIWIYDVTCHIPPNQAYDKRDCTTMWKSVRKWQPCVRDFKVVRRMQLHLFTVSERTHSHAAAGKHGMAVEKEELQ